MLQHSKSPLVHPIVDEIVVDGCAINIRCPGDYGEAQRRVWRSAQILPLNAVSAQGTRITVAVESAEVVYG